MYKIALFFAFICLLELAFAEDYVTQLCKAKYVSYKKTRKPTDYPPTFISAYSTNLTEIREEAFMKNCRDVEHHNKKKRKSYRKGINRFSDWTDEEFKSFLSLRMPHNLGQWQTHFAEYNDSIEISPNGTDLRKMGWVNPVRDQGFCMSCWAFAATSAFEINHAKKFGKTEASEQWLVDCDKKSLGCRGGWQNWAYDMVLESGHKVAARDGYREYNAQDGECQTPTKYAGTLSVYLKTVSENEMPNNVENYGAIAVAIDASTLGSYQDGVFTGSCGGPVTHAVTIVGYGTENGQKYWLLRNSWGPHWGEDGYFKILRGINHCKVADYAYIPVSDAY